MYHEGLARLLPLPSISIKTRGGRHPSGRIRGILLAKLCAFQRKEKEQRHERLRDSGWFF